MAMTRRRVWVRPGGLVLAHAPDGWPLPAGHVDAVGGRAVWLWPRSDVWPCHWTRYRDVCEQVAVWRSIVPNGGVPWRNYWCDRHLPHRKPTEQPTPLCVVCGGPMSFPDGHGTHPGCDTASHADAAMTDGVIELLSTVLGAEVLP
jgi:hypothetical protein